MIDAAKGSLAENARRQTERYWFEDGIPQIAGGLTLLAVSAGFVILDRFWWTYPFLVVLGIAWSLLGSRAIRAAKARLTYPRTGYVDYPQPNTWLVVVITIASMILSQAPASNSWFLSAIGLFVGAWMVYAWGRLRLGCAVLIAPVSIVLGLGIPLLLTGDVIVAAAIYCAGIGIALSISGALAYRTYSRTAPRPEES